MRWLAAAVLAAMPGMTADLRTDTLAAFDRYVQQTEQRLDQQKGRLWSDEKPERANRVRGGEGVVEPFSGKPMVEVPHGLIHDWVGAAFLPRATVAQTLALVQNYDRHEDIYKPEVIEAPRLSHEGNHFRVFLRLLKKQVIAIVLDTEHEVVYEKIDDKTWRSLSRTTRISEVENAGKPSEKVLPAGTGQGFLWRLNSYWRFHERDGGTWIECEAMSLT